MTDSVSSLPRRLMLAMGATLVGVLVVEGASSMIRGRGVIAHRMDGDLDDWVVALRKDADRFAAAAKLEGIYRKHIDPLVRYTCRANSAFEIRGVGVTTDELGMRRRIGDAPPSNALRIAIVGDSVAFGYGVKDDEVLAARLEQRWTAGIASHDSAQRAIACFTIASPGWNLRQALRFLEAHGDEIRPDVVVLLPMNNDLYDADDVAESGHRFLSPDPAQREPMLLASANAASFLSLGLLALRRRNLGPLRENALPGTEAMISGLTQESRARYGDVADAIVALERRLRATGGRLVLARYVEEAFTYRLQRAIVERGVEPDVVPLFRRVSRELTLLDDPHPNAKTFDAMAIVLANHLAPKLYGESFRREPLRSIASEIAAELVRDGELPDAGATLRYVDDATRAELRPAFDTTTAEGGRQSYGGVNPDGTLGIRAKLALARVGVRLSVHLQPLAARPDLAENAVEVFADGVRIGIVESRLGEIDAKAEFALPAEASDPHAIEIDLVARRYGVTTLAGASQVASMRVVRIEVIPDGTAPR